MNPSTALARVLVDALVGHGVRELVLSPGSRSAPLAMAALAASRELPERGPRTLRLHVRIDERSAGFLALGLAKASGQTVAVLTTSGTGAANLHPAVLEAHHAGTPLIVLTADRPVRLRGVGANQTTDQVGLFGGVTRFDADLGAVAREPGQVRYWRDVVTRAVAAARGTVSADPGPVHLNVAFDEPLLDDGDDDWPEPLDLGVRPTRVAAAGPPQPYSLPAGPRTVVLAGDGAGWEARWLAETAGWPLLAEPSSRARTGPNAIGPYRMLLDAPGLGADIERVVVLGHATLSRPVTRLLARDDVEVVVVTRAPRWVDPARRASLVVAEAFPPGGFDDRLPGTRTYERHGSIKIAGRAEPDAWLGTWLAAAQRAEAALDNVLAGQLSGPAVARAIGATIGWGPGRSHQLLVAGSSSAVRDLDLAMRPHTVELETGDGGIAAGHHDLVLANRGLSGIDGTISTAVGAALGRQLRTVAMLGDLAFLHDANGLVIGPDEPRPDLTIVVVNDDGGGLFHLLEQGAPDHAESFERVFGTPHGVDLRSLCAATRTPFAHVASIDELTGLLGQVTPGIRVIEVPIERSDRRELHERIRGAVEDALHGLAGSTP